MRYLFAVVVLGWFTVAPAFGATTNSPPASYEIEVLVFEVQLPEFEGSELWTRIEQPVDTSEALAPEELQPTKDFVEAADTLRADGRYRVLLQKRWRQNAEPKSAVPGMRLTTWDKELDGIVKFYVSRFLHVEVNLEFQPQTTVIGGDAAPSYAISEQRRVKSNDMNYFDHPKFGVVLRVTPVKG